MQMPAAITRLLKPVAAVLLSLASIFMLLIMVVFIATLLGVGWVSSTTSGQQFLSRQLTVLAAESGYSIEIGSIRAVGAGQLLIERVNLRQGDAPVADISRILLRPSMTALMTGEAKLDLRIRQLIIHPSVDALAPPTDTPPSLSRLIPAAADMHRMAAGLPLDRFSLDTLHIDQLAFADAAGEVDEPFSLTLKSDMIRGPRMMTLTAELDVQGIREDGPITATLDTHMDLSEEAPGIFIDRLHIVSGNIDQTITGHLALPRDAADTSPLPLLLETVFADQPVRIAGLVDQVTGFALNDMAISGPGIAAGGSIQQDSSGTWRGALDASLAMDELAAALPPAKAIPLRDTLDITLSFNGPELSLNMPRLSLPPADLRDITITTTPLTDGGKGDRSITLTAKEQASAAALKLSANLRQDAAGMWRIEGLDTTLTAGNAGSVTLRGDAATDVLALTLEAASLRLDRLKGPLAMPEGTPPIRLDATQILLTGSAAEPVIDWQSRITPTALPKTAPGLRADMTGRIAAGLATIHAKLISKSLREGTINLQHPLRLSLQPFVFEMPHEGLSGRGSLRGGMAALNGFLPVGLRLDGNIGLDITLGGSLAAPTVGGNVSWQKGRARDTDSGLSLRDIDMAAQFNQDHITLQKLTARDGKSGTITAQGRLDLTPGAWPVDATVKMQNIDPFTNTVTAADMPLIDGVFSADLTLKGARHAYLLAGNIASRKLSIQLPERFSTSVPQLNIIEKRAQKKSALPGLDALALKIALSIPQQIFVRGWGLDAEFGGTLTIAGTAATPLITGMLQSIRGRYEEFGRRFTLSRARLDFRGAIPPSPFLDIVADTRVDGIDASVVLSGSASAPTVAFTSTPSMPSEDVLAHILFGTSRANITPTQALQLAQTLRRFSGAGGAGLDPLGSLRSGIGLDDLSVNSDAEGGASVGAGKYLSDEVYLELDSGNATESGAAKLKIDLTPNIKVESKVGQDAQSGAGIFWEWEY